MSYQAIWKKLKNTKECKIECSSNPLVHNFISRKVSKIKDRDVKFKDSSHGIYKLRYEKTEIGMRFWLEKHKWALNEEDYAEDFDPNQAAIQREEVLKIATEVVAKKGKA